jgi:hypothetical protein
MLNKNHARRGRARRRKESYKKKARVTHFLGTVLDMPSLLNTSLAWCYASHGEHRSHRDEHITSLRKTRDRLALKEALLDTRSQDEQDAADDFESQRFYADDKYDSRLDEECEDGARWVIEPGLALPPEGDIDDDDWYDWEAYTF